MISNMSNNSFRMLVQVVSGCDGVFFLQTYERPPKPPTIRSSYTRTLILDTIMKLSGTIGVTQKTMTLDTHVC